MFHVKHSDVKQADLSQKPQVRLLITNFRQRKNHRSGKAMVIGVGVTSLYKNDVNYFFIIPGEEEYMKKDC